MISNYKLKFNQGLKLILNFSFILLISSQISCKPQRKDKGIIIASNGKVESLDPAQANKLLAIQLISALGDTLYRMNAKGDLEPRLALAKPIISSDGLTISIPLREDVLFHDGTLFDSYAMAFSLKRFMNIGTHKYIEGGRIKGIETPSKFLLIIKLSRPSSSIKGLLTSINLTPVSPTHYRDYDNKFLVNNFVGTGPYRLTSYSPERQTFVPFENYWGKKINNSGISYKRYNTSTSLFSAIKTGQVDILLSNSIEDGQRVALNKLSQKGFFNQAKGPAMEIGYIVFRSNSKILKRKEIRKALMYSIDRRLISKRASYGLREPLRSLSPPILGLSKYPAWPTYNPELAKSLFEKAGFCNNNKLVLPLTFRSNVPSDKLLALTWQEQVNRDFSDCLELSLNGVESTTVYKQLSEGAYEAVILDWTGDYSDPYAYLSPILDCKKIKGEVCKKGEAVSGGSFWANIKLQESLEKSETLLDEKRLEELRKVEQIAADGAAILPIWLVSPSVWTQKVLNQPEFDNSGRILLEKLFREDD